MTLTELTATVRKLLNNPDVAEITDPQIEICWRRALDAYSKYVPRKEAYYDAGFVLVSDQAQYAVPSETNAIRACRIYPSVADIKSNLKYFETYQNANPNHTGYGNFKWEFLYNKLVLSDFPAAIDAGQCIGLLLFKSHIFTAGACDTIPRSEFEGPLLNWCKGDILEEWAGYAGSISYGSGREDRQVLRDEAQKLKKAAETYWSLGIS